MRKRVLASALMMGIVSLGLIGCAEETKPTDGAGAAKPADTAKPADKTE